jgi:hypothetical protein
MIRKEMTRKQMIVSVCIVIALVIWFIHVSQSTCGSGEDCSAYGTFIKLIGGIRELFGLNG